MSKKANPTLVGGFVIGALILLVAGIVTFGSGRFFERTYTYVGLFKGSVKGLSIGAPVSFRGIKVGSVSNILGLVDSRTKKLYVAVYMEFIPQSGGTAVVGKGGDPATLSGPRFLDYLIHNEGLRAQLQVQSLLTNQLYVALVLKPGAPVNFPGKELGLGVPEMPTEQSSLQRLTKTVETLPLEDIAVEVRNTVANVNRFLADPQLKHIVHNLADASRELKLLLQALGTDAPAITGDLRQAASSARLAMDQARATLALEQGVPGEIGANLNRTLLAATATLEQADRSLTLSKGEPGRIARDLRQVLGQAQGTLSDIRDVFRDDSPLQTAVRELSEAARSFRVFADYLERHPEALIKGKERY
jgi:paraquat-inducible protein B